MADTHSVAERCVFRSPPQIFEGNKVFLEELSSNWSGVVEIDKFAVFLLLYLCKSETRST